MKLQIVVLDMTLEEQKERISARHGGSQDVMDLMKVRVADVNEKDADIESDICRCFTICASPWGRMSPIQLAWWSAQT